MNAARTICILAVLASGCDDSAADGKAKRTPQPAPQPDPEPPASRFTKGEPAPAGLSPQELAEYNAAQGDPLQGPFTLARALGNNAALTDGAAGRLTATFETTMGSFACTLFEEQAPLTVANFVGLSLGTRPWYDKKTDQWVTDRPYYDGIIFHRAVKGFMVQTGDRRGGGSGGPGYVIVDEIDPKLSHAKPGTLSMANLGQNTGGSQFFVTVGKAKHLDGKHTIFGRCDPAVAKKISVLKVDPRRNARPYDRVAVTKITIGRTAG